MFGKKQKRPPGVWHNPDPESIGTVVREHFTADRQLKATVIQNREGCYTVYLYRFDDSDRREGWTDTVGWAGLTGPSITDTVERADALAVELIGSNQSQTERRTSA